MKFQVIAMTVNENDDDPIVLTAEEIALAEAPYGSAPDADATKAKDTTKEDTTDEVEDRSEGDEEQDGGTDAADETTEGEGQDGNKNVEQGSSPFSGTEINRAKSLGLKDEDIADFATSKSLNRYLDLVEKLNGIKVASGGEGSSSDTKQEGKSNEQDASSDLLDISLYDGTDSKYAGDEFDERSLAVAKAVRREQELRVETQRELAGLREFVAQLQQERIVTQFSDAVDALGIPELGEARDSRGRFAELNPKQVEQRSRLFAEVEKIAAEQQSNGLKNLTWEQTVAEAGKRLGFKPGKSEASNKAEALKRQSAMRRPVSKSTAKTKMDQHQLDPHSVEAIAENPEIVAFWNENVGR